LSCRGRSCVQKIRRAKSEGAPAYRKFDGKIFRLQTVQPSIREANWWIEEYKKDFYIRKVRGPGGVYVVYVRRKHERSGI